MTDALDVMTPWTVLFAGPGDAEEAAVAAELDNWLPKEAGSIEDLVLPDKINRTQKGLRHVRAWLNKEFSDGDEDGYTTTGDMLRALEEYSSNDANVFLVLLWGEDGDPDSWALLEKATALGIPCRSLSTDGGLDDLVIQADE